ncbi:MAG: response regulator transcription factor [Desulfovermiculus sp.]|nr:response regulator transcription factor [Desulfovermiculus sp.]
MAWKDFEMNKAGCLDMEYQILVVSNESFHFQTLSYLVQSHFNISCDKLSYDSLIQSVLNDTDSYDKQLRKILLWDYKVNEESKLLDTLKKIRDNRLFSKIDFCVFNLPNDTQLEPFFIKSNVQAVLYDNYELELFIKALKTIMKGELWFSRQILSDHLKENIYGKESTFYDGSLSTLTPREKEILYMIAAGKTNHDIAKELFISISTVKSHVYNIFRKIDVPNRIQAALWTVKYLGNHP